MDAKTFRTMVIDKVLATMGGSGAAAAELLLGTAVQESLCFKYRRQMGGGPALGYYQMEPRTHDDIWANYLKYRPKLAAMADSFLQGKSTGSKSAALETNDRYATAMARIHYMRVPAPLPKVGDVDAQARYWKQYYNTPLGKGKVQEYIDKWNKFVLKASP